MANPKKSKAEIPTIDVALVTIEDSNGNEFGFDTSNSIATEPQLETQDAVKLMIKGKLKAQKKEKSTLTGIQITLTDNVFNPELVKMLQGGSVTYGSDGAFQTYTPPVQGSDDTGKEFTLNAYSAQYNAAGQIVAYEKTSYPNCTGVPVSFNSTDDEFRAPEYTINSAPADGQAPYKIEMVKTLPVLADSPSSSSVSA